MNVCAKWLNQVLTGVITNAMHYSPFLQVATTNGKAVRKHKVNHTWRKWMRPCNFSSVVPSLRTRNVNTSKTFLPRGHVAAGCIIFGLVFFMVGYFPDLCLRSFRLIHQYGEANTLVRQTFQKKDKNVSGKSFPQHPAGIEPTGHPLFWCGFSWLESSSFAGTENYGFFLSMRGHFVRLHTIFCPEGIGTVEKLRTYHVSFVVGYFPDFPVCTMEQIGSDAFFTLKFRPLVYFRILRALRDAACVCDEANLCQEKRI